MAEAGPRLLTIANRRGLHARASARFVTLASQFESQLFVAKDGHEVLGVSIMGLMMLGAGQGEQISLRAAGPDAEAALDALSRLVEEGFGED